MSEALAGLLGALIGGAAAVAGAWLQIRGERRAAREEREAAAEEAEAEQRTLADQRRQILARRYLFGLQDATESLRKRLENWADEGGQAVAEARDPGYWGITTLYVVARALAAERILALEGVYPALEADLPELVGFFKSAGVESALDDTVGERLFRYHRLALAEAALERDAEGFRVLIYSEFRRRYEDATWGLQRLLAPATDALDALTDDEMRELEGRLDEMAALLETVTHVPRQASPERASSQGVIGPSPGGAPPPRTRSRPTDASLAARIVCRGEVRVPIPADEALRLFTPRGEREWAHGWDPSFPGADADDSEPGTVFTTEGHHGGGQAIWIVAHRTGRSIRYARAIPGQWAGTVEVRCEPAGAETLARVTYDLTVLDDAQRPRLREFAAGYADYMAEWERELAAALRRAS
jgi:hypothetical protein